MRARLPAKLFGIGLIVGLVASLGSAQAAGTVVVNWVDPVNFADAGRNVVDRERTLQMLGEHMQTLGARLAQGQVLRLEVLNLDLAGELRPWHSWGMDEVRVLGDRADSPHMQLRYTLQGGGQTLASGEATLRDLGYLFRQRSGALAYEKHMLDQWFERSFGALTHAR